MTAKAALDAAEGLTGVRRVRYVGYASAERPENFSEQNRDMKCAVYWVTLADFLIQDILINIAPSLLMRVNDCYQRKLRKIQRVPVSDLI